MLVELNGSTRECTAAVWRNFGTVPSFIFTVPFSRPWLRFLLPLVSVVTFSSLCHGCSSALQCSLECGVNSLDRGVASLNRSVTALNRGVASLNRGVTALNRGVASLVCVSSVSALKNAPRIFPPAAAAAADGQTDAGRDEKEEKMRLARAVKELTELVRHKGRDIQVMYLEAVDRGSGERERERERERARHRVGCDFLRLEGARREEMGEFLCDLFV